MYEVRIFAADFMNIEDRVNDFLRDNKDYIKNVVSISYDTSSNNRVAICYEVAD